MTEVPLSVHFDSRLRSLEKAMDKTEGGLLDRVKSLELQVERLRRTGSRRTGQIDIVTTVVSMAVSAIVSAVVAAIATQWWGS